MMYHIYYTYCFSEKKGFVGFTENFTPNKKWNINYKSQRMKLLLEARKKYGDEVFATKILFKTWDVQEAIRKEAEFIKKLNTWYPNGYNCGHGYSPILDGKIKSNKENLKQQFQKLQKELDAMLK